MLIQHVHVVKINITILKIVLLVFSSHHCFIHFWVILYIWMVFEAICVSWILFHQWAITKLSSSFCKGQNPSEESSCAQSVFITVPWICVNAVNWKWMFSFSLLSHFLKSWPALSHHFLSWHNFRMLNIRIDAPKKRCCCHLCIFPL